MLNFHTRYGNVFSYIHTENGDRVEKVIISGRWKYKSMTAEMDFLHSLKKKKKSQHQDIQGKNNNLTFCSRPTLNTLMISTTSICSDSVKKKKPHTKKTHSLDVMNILKTH